MIGKDALHRKRLRRSDYQVGDQRNI